MALTTKQLFQGRTSSPAPGSLQPSEPGDPELRAPADAPAEYERQPGDPDPAGTTLVDMTLQDIARMDADDVARINAVDHDADPDLVVNLGGQNAIADTGINLEGNDRAIFDTQAPEGGVDLMSRAPIDWPDSERLGSVTNVALTDDLVPVDVLVGVAEQVIRTCIADALRAWPDDIVAFMDRKDRNVATSETPILILHEAIRANLRDKHIDPGAVWPFVRRVTYQAFESAFARTFGTLK